MMRRLAAMAGMRVLLGRCALVLASIVAFGSSASFAARVRVWRVGTYKGILGQFQTIQAAVNAARPGDWILIAPGDYHENGSADPEHPAGVLIRTSGVHVRGLDRNSVIVDGTRAGAPAPCSSDPAFQVTGRDGVVVYKASGTYVENLTVCNFLTDPVTGEHGNQIWWNGGDGSGQIGMHTYWGNYLTASSTYSNGTNHPRGEYGIFVSNADGPGSINYSYASNMGDAAFYVGACPSCNAVLDHDRAQYSALAYSGTNSGGNLTIQNCEFDHNKTGLVSNSQNNDDLPSPQIGLCPAGSSPAVPGAVGCTIFMNNYFHDNNEADVPGSGSGLSGSAPVGTGVVLAGTEYVTLYNNRIERNGAWGVLVADLPDQETPPPEATCQGGLYYDPTTQTCYYQAFGNFVWDNQFADNGFFGNPTNGDIGLATILHDPGNCFDANTDPVGLTTDPPNLQSPPYNPCGSANAGDMGPLAAEALCATQLLAPCPTLPGASYPRPDPTFTLPAIPPQPGIPNPCAGVPRNPWCP